MEKILYVQINRCKSSLKFSFYRKPIKENTVIQFSDNVPSDYKISAFRSFIKRAFMICSDDILNKEIEFIQKTAFEHGFPANFVKKIVQQYNTPPTSGQQQDKLAVYRKFHYIPYIFKKVIKKIAQKYNIKLTAIPPPYFIDIVTDKIGKIPIDQKSCVYEITITLSNNVKIAHQHGNPQTFN